MSAARFLGLAGFLGALVTLGGLAGAQAPVKPAAVPLPAEQRRRFGHALQELQRDLDAAAAVRQARPDSYADAAVFAKAVAWALRYDTAFTPADVARIEKGLARGRQRLAALKEGKQPWAHRPGRAARAFVSALDGSVQPYGIALPAGYTPDRPRRLDVVLHGSQKPVGMSELRFLDAHDDGDEGGKAAPARDYIEVFPLGRVENCYRWAGEADVFEAIEAACRNYKVDRDRIVLRGMSMGASGTWHLGLKYPDRFVALGPYCGYVDTHRFSLTPLPSFPKVGPLPWQQEKTLHMLDSVDYAANAGIVPAVAAMGEKDVFFQAHVIMGRAMEKEGLKMVNLISPGTGHVIDPVVHREQMRRIGEYAARGLDHAPPRIRLVTWTLRYSRAHWLEVRGLREHYARSELDASLTDDGVDFHEPQNVVRFAIHAEQLPRPVARVRHAGFVLPVPDNIRRGTIEVAWQNGEWRIAEPARGQADPVKEPGLQGPIDDAFTRPFLCVRGTGRPWNAAVQTWADASLTRFAAEWHQYFRSELPVKNDTDVTERDVAGKNLILFGDPGSNPWIAKVLPQLGIRWTREEVRVGEQSHPASQYVPLLIRPNPLPGARGRYVVVNSGHTFHGKDLATINYLLFPRLGDWAVLYIAGKPPADPADGPAEEVVRAGFFDEQWKVKTD